jgi:pimeloyl-ACP methyl ester carboxylesterase
MSAAARKHISLYQERQLQQRDIQLKRVRLHVLDWQGDEPTMVLLHPNRTNARVWDFVVRASRLKNRFIAFDQRGHGLSEYPSEGYAFDDYIADDLELIDRLGLGTIILVGAATGGNLSLLIASRYPERVRALVIADPGLSLNKSISQRVQGEIRQQFRFPDFETAKAAMPFSQYWSGEMREHYARESFRILSTGEAEWRYYPPGIGSTEALLEQDLWEYIKVVCPTLILRGIESDVFPPENLRRLQSIIPHAQSAIIPKAYHRLSQDNPQEMARLIDEFVEGLP